MRICYIGEPLGSDTQIGSTNTLRAGLKRGYKIWQVQPENVSLLNGKIIGKGQKFDDKPGKKTDKIFD